MATYFMLGDDSREYGPATVEQIRQWMAEGRANAQTRVRVAEGSTWVLLGLVPELAGQPVPPPVAPVPPNYGPAYPPAPQLILPKPPNYLVFAILLTLCCCLPFGVVALVYATQVDSHYYAGNYAAALSASGNALMWCCIGLVLGLLWPVPLLLL